MHSFAHERCSENCSKCWLCKKCLLSRAKLPFWAGLCYGEKWHIRQELNTIYLKIQLKKHVQFNHKSLVTNMLFKLYKTVLLFSRNFTTNSVGKLQCKLCIKNKSISEFDNTLASKEAAFFLSSCSTCSLIWGEILWASKLTISSFTPRLAKKLFEKRNETNHVSSSKNYTILLATLQQLQYCRTYMVTMLQRYAQPPLHFISEFVFLVSQISSLSSPNYCTDMLIMITPLSHDWLLCCQLLVELHWCNTRMCALHIQTQTRWKMNELLRQSIRILVCMHWSSPRLLKWWPSGKIQSMAPLKVTCSQAIK